MYKVDITTKNGIITEYINNISELENILIKYYEIYTGVRVEEVGKVLKK